jgi:hypothetical protein
MGSKIPALGAVALGCFLLGASLLFFTMSVGNLLAYDWQSGWANILGTRGPGIDAGASLFGVGIFILAVIVFYAAGCLWRDPSLL